MTITMYGNLFEVHVRVFDVVVGEPPLGSNAVAAPVGADAADIVLERNNGLKRIPVIVFGDDSHLTEPSNEALEAKMAELSDEACATPAFEVTENSDAGRFELNRDGDLVSFASFSLRDDVVVIPHVETMPEHRGQGYAAQLLDGILENLETSDRKVMPLCPFAAKHLRDNEQYHHLLAGS